MREIKFRGMTINGEWVYGFAHVVPRVPSKYQRVEAGTYISNSVGSPFAYQVRSETVGEYTGLRDKNGIEIYEGDIIHDQLYDAGIAPVVWSDERGAWVANFQQWNRVETEFLWDYHECSEVIGNIYEHPDLLREQVAE